MNETYLSLGSNEGDRIKWLKRSIKLLTPDCGTIIKQSSIYETAAWGLTAQPDFLNMVMLMQTNLSPMDLLAAILNIEITLGRQRNVKWGLRTIDIDILFYNDIILETPTLTIPHRLLSERRFVLVPLAEIAPHLIHPKLYKTIDELLADCPDKLAVSIYSKK